MGTEGVLPLAWFSLEHHKYQNPFQARGALVFPGAAYKLMGKVRMQWGLENHGGYGHADSSSDHM